MSQLLTYAGLCRVFSEFIIIRYRDFQQQDFEYLQKVTFVVTWDFNKIENTDKLEEQVNQLHNVICNILALPYFKDYIARNCDSGLDLTFSSEEAQKITPELLLPYSDTAHNFYTAVELTVWMFRNNKQIITSTGDTDKTHNIQIKLEKQAIDLASYINQPALQARALVVNAAYKNVYLRLFLESECLIAEYLACAAPLLTQYVSDEYSKYKYRVNNILCTNRFIQDLSEKSTLMSIYFNQGYICPSFQSQKKKMMLALFSKNTSSYETGRLLPPNYLDRIRIFDYRLVKHESRLYKFNIHNITRRILLNKLRSKFSTKLAFEKDILKLGEDFNNPSRLTTESFNKASRLQTTLNDESQKDIYRRLLHYDNLRDLPRSLRSVENKIASKLQNQADESCKQSNYDNQNFFVDTIGNKVLSYLGTDHDYIIDKTSNSKCQKTCLNETVQTARNNNQFCHSCNCYSGDFQQNNFDNTNTNRVFNNNACNAKINSHTTNVTVNEELNEQQNNSLTNSKLNLPISNTEFTGYCSDLKNNGNESVGSSYASTKASRSSPSILDFQRYFNKKNLSSFMFSNDAISENSAYHYTLNRGDSFSCKESTFYDYVSYESRLIDELVYELNAKETKLSGLLVRIKKLFVISSFYEKNSMFLINKSHSSHNSQQCYYFIKASVNGLIKAFDNPDAQELFDKTFCNSDCLLSYNLLEHNKMFFSNLVAVEVLNCTRLYINSIIYMAEKANMKLAGLSMSMLVDEAYTQYKDIIYWILQLLDKTIANENYLRRSFLKLEFVKTIFSLSFVSIVEEYVGLFLNLCLSMSIISTENILTLLNRYSDLISELHFDKQKKLFLSVELFNNSKNQFTNTQKNLELGYIT